MKAAEMKERPASGGRRRDAGAIGKPSPGFFCEMSRPGAFALLLGRQLTPAVHCGLVVRPIAQQRTGEGQPWACGMDLGQRHTAGSTGPAAKTLFCCPPAGQLSLIPACAL